MSKQKQYVYTTCSELGIFMYCTRNSMNNLLSYCGLVDTRISASDKDLPVLVFILYLSTCIEGELKKNTDGFKSGGNILGQSASKY